MQLNAGSLSNMSMLISDIVFLYGIDLSARIHASKSMGRTFVSQLKHSNLMIYKRSQKKIKHFSDFRRKMNGITARKDPNQAIIRSIIQNILINCFICIGFQWIQHLFQMKIIKRWKRIHFNEISSRKPSVFMQILLSSGKSHLILHGGSLWKLCLPISYF